MRSEPALAAIADRLTITVSFDRSDHQRNPARCRRTARAAGDSIKPGVERSGMERSGTPGSNVDRPVAREAGDSRRGNHRTRQNMIRCRPLRGLAIPFCRHPGAYAPGLYSLPPLRGLKKTRKRWLFEERSMKSSIILAMAILFLSTPAVFAQKVNVDVDSTANFSSFKTFG